ncbi:MAG: S49 family peptidase [Rhizobiales bacterium]|nr:S49 family peptidase [Hyphomicrobiales bacterium]
MLSSLFDRGPVVPVLRITGPIGLATPLRPGVSLATMAGLIERLFKAARRSDAVAIVINSPGGSPVQSRLIFKRIRDLAGEHGKKVYVFAEDVMASGGYMLALAGDEIWADASSIVGSVGVISAGFGFHRAIERLGIERRVFTAGEHKRLLDPFEPAREDDVKRLRALQDEIHTIFKDMVRERRGERLVAPDADVFEGQVFLAREAVRLGLIDGVGDLRTRMRAIYGDKVRLKVVTRRSGLVQRLVGATMFGETTGEDAIGRLGGTGLTDQVVASLEERELWSRYGL